MSDASAQDKGTNGGNAVGFWPDATVDAISAVVVVVAAVAMALYFVGGDLLIQALL